MKPLSCLIISLVLMIGSVNLRAQNSDSAFESANKLYYEGKYAEAAAAYQKLIGSGQVAPALYFNLGNSFFKSGLFGRAIAAYHQAESLTPRDPDLRANLQFARNQTQGPSFSPNRAQHWLQRLTLNEWTVITCSIIWLWLLAFAALQFRPAWKRAARGLLIVLAIGSLVLGACFTAAIYDNLKWQTAVVITPEAVVRRGPLEESQTAFSVHDGAELRVLDRKDDWLLVTTDPRRIGWLKKDQVLLASR